MYPAVGLTLTRRLARVGGEACVAGSARCGNVVGLRGWFKHTTRATDVSDGGETVELDNLSAVPNCESNKTATPHVKRPLKWLV